ncbi:MAG: ornithine carbamoyltransferase [Thermoguttaceae bacterium]
MTQQKVRHFIDLADVSNSELNRIMELAAQIKADHKAGRREPLLQRKVLGLVFEKMSLRTRVSFEAGMAHLGGSSMFLEEQHIGFGKREPVADISHVLSSMVDVIAFRAKEHQSVLDLARYSTCPVINALTDRSHPCQALADMFTVKEEFGTYAVKIAWIGDSNNVAASLIEAAAKLGAEIIVSSPEGYRFSEDDIARMTSGETTPDFKITFESDPFKAAKDARVIATDVWVSMGQEAEEKIRKKIFAPYQVNAKLMAQAAPDAIFLHCLPARRGLEVTEDVIDSPRSRIVQEAENRMHAQKGLLVWLLNEAQR